MTPRPEQDLERALSRALRAEGDRIVPADRLEAILAAADTPHVAEVRSLHSRRVVLAAAAAAAVVVGGFWTLGDRTDTTGRVGSPPASRSTTPDTTPPTGALQVRPKSIPVYLVGREGGAGSPTVLVRVFDRVLLTGPARPSDLVQQVGAALRLSTSSSATSDGVGTIANADAALVTGVTAGDTIVVDLSSTPRVATSAGAERLLAAWLRTVQGVVGRGDLSVRFRAADGAPLLGHLDGDRTWRQGDVAGIPLAQIWIDDPSTPVPGPDVTARGVASVFEAALSWELLRDGSVVDSGTVTASEGAPARGTWQVRLTGLTPGSYTLRVLHLSVKDGSVDAERRGSFSVTGS